MAVEAGQARERVFDEIGEVVDIAQDDVEHVIVASRDVVCDLDFRNLCHALLERVDRLNLVLTQVDHDERLHGVADGFRINDGAIGGDNAFFFDFCLLMENYFLYLYFH